MFFPFWCLYLQWPLAISWGFSLSFISGASMCNKYLMLFCCSFVFSMPAIESEACPLSPNNLVRAWYAYSQLQASHCVCFLNCSADVLEQLDTPQKRMDRASPVHPQKITGKNRGECGLTVELFYERQAVNLTAQSNWMPWGIQFEGVKFRVPSEWVVWTR